MINVTKDDLTFPKGNDRKGSTTKENNKGVSEVVTSHDLIVDQWDNQDCTHIFWFITREGW